MSRATIDLWVGVFAAAGIIALMLLAFKVSNASTSFRRRRSTPLRPSSRTSAA